MRLHSELFRGLLAGLPEGDQSQILVAIQRTHSEQLSSVAGPPPQRRRRGADGVLRMPDGDATPPTTG